MKKTSTGQSPQRKVSKQLLKSQEHQETATLTSGVDSGMATRSKTELITKEKTEMEELRNSVRDLKEDVKAGNLNLIAGNEKILAGIGALQKKVDDVQEELTGKITKVAEESTKMFEAVHETISANANAVKDLEAVVEEMAGEMEAMKLELDSLKSQFTKVSDKCVDLEARSRRQNIRIRGVKEGAEGENTREFTANLIKHVLNLPEAPVIEEAHRVPRFKPRFTGEQAYPRQIIVKLRDIPTVEALLKKIKYGEKMIYGNDSIKLLRDYPYEIVLKRRKFSQTREVLYGVKGVISGVFYPARMRITFKGISKTFTNPLESLKYAKEIVVKAAAAEED